MMCVTPAVIFIKVAPSTQTCSASRNGILLPQYTYNMYDICCHVTLFAIIFIIIYHFIVDLYIKLSIGRIVVYAPPLVGWKHKIALQVMWPPHDCRIAAQVCRDVSSSCLATDAVPVEYFILLSNETLRRYMHIVYSFPLNVQCCIIGHFSNKLLR